jgi:hypothetical protein
VVLRRRFFITFATASTAVLLFAFNNCSARDAGSTTGSTSLASSTCKINPEDQLVAHQKDGDDDVRVFAAPEDAARMMSEKIYFNNTGDAATAPRWKLTDNVVPWYYNPAGVPANLSSQALSVIQDSMNYWSSVCNIKFNYLGTTTKASDVNAGDATNVVGWGAAGGATGITYSYMKGTKAPLSISESDIQFNNGQIFDATTLRGVMNHELGHLIGMRHSDVVESILFANPYHDIPYLLTLRKDDIDACVGLYGLPGAAATPTPTPTATPAPTATPTPVPTATPRPTVTPVPTATPRPSATPVPTATPRPSATPVPTATPRPTATPGSSQGC